MTEPLTDTWNSRELPVLRTIVQAFEENPRVGRIRKTQIAAALDMPLRQVERAIVRLLRGEYIVARSNAGSLAEAAEIGIIVNVTEKALRATGAWPTPESGYDRMVTALEELADMAGDEDIRGRPRGFAAG